MAPKEREAGAYHGALQPNQMRWLTLLRLRWFAIIGQSLAVAVAVLFYQIELPIALIVGIISTAIVANLFFMQRYPRSKRLSEKEVLWALLFDLAQLSLLLLFTGGLDNPFAMLLLVPVTISATILAFERTVLLGGVVLGCITLLSLLGFPLQTSTGETLSLPLLFKFGFWLSLNVSLVFLAIYARQVTYEMGIMTRATQAAQFALERAQKLSDVGGIVAATAHELGTPLATIKLTSGELYDELSKVSGQSEEVLEDIRLIHQETDRCRDILRSMGEAGQDDDVFQTAQLEAIAREAAEPHVARGIDVQFYAIGPNDVQPHMPRSPEILHGVRNLIQNAVDFAQQQVSVELHWGQGTYEFHIIDDGEGFSDDILEHIGEPFIKSGRSSGLRMTQTYEGMGLGLFIAKTLLEKSGASLEFSNHPLKGAMVKAIWQQDAFEGNALFL